MQMSFLLESFMFATPARTSEKTLKELERLWAKYDVVESESKEPNLTHVILSLPAVEMVKGKEAIWFQLEAFSENERLYAVALLVSSLDFLRPGGADVNVYRYLLFPATGNPLEFISSSTGEAILPPFDFFKNLLPHAQDTDDSKMPFFAAGTYLGRSLRLRKKGIDASLLRLKDVRRLELEEDVLIGTGRNFKDAEGKRLYLPGQPPPPDEPDYTYVTFTEDDYRQMIERAGMNLFNIASSQLPYVVEQPVFFILREGFEESFDLLYRSNFLGSVQFMDEPAWLVMAHNEVTDAQTPQEASSRLIEMVKERYAGDGSYGMHNLMKRLRDAGYDFGEGEILQPDFPVWETVTSAAWYEFEAGVPGYVFEGRYRPKQFADLVKRKLDIDFPDDIESCLQFHYAFYRGAARHFGGKWGVAIYGQMALDAADMAFPLAYAEGATYFWFWTSDHSHHVPFIEQISFTRKFRDYIKAHPRSATPAELTANAKVAIALPWGYLFDDATLNFGMMWKSPHMKLEEDNGHGVNYKEVLKKAMQKAVKLLQGKTRFDILFLREGEKVDGYDEVYRMLVNGEVTHERF